MESCHTTWLCELERFPARWLSELPDPVSFAVHVPDFDELLTIVTWEIPEPRAAVEGALVMDSLELAALVTGVEAGRFLSDDLVALCERKRAMPETRLDLDTALAGAVDDEPAPPLSLGEVLRALDASLVAVAPRAELARACESTPETAGAQRAA